ncbi:hypothetical protein [Clostridium sp. BNL1100]|uniref:hypothetical protein n=1 Tax=Clostridium sp. BNL1100 TaxID=755731 RepID=UPI00024A79BD|nr:hypothetical protein [Clostridium sp. BNL1100]AEY67900.1 hypothetical protein Clo1100_3786 [Clostridium sp. BNL1100]
MAVNTVNYNLKKPSQEDFYNIEDHNGNMDIIDTQIKKIETELEGHEGDTQSHVPHLGTTVNNGNAYTIEFEKTILDGSKFSVKFNTIATGPATLNIPSDGLARSLKKPSGEDFKPKAGIYSFIRDGENFQLLGEGGEYGTNNPNDVKVGIPFGTENGIQIGTYTSDATATAADIMLSKIAYANGQQLVGTNTNKRWVSGTFNAGYASNGYTGVSIYGLPFKPRLVYIYGVRTSPVSLFQYIVLVDTPFYSRNNVKGFYMYGKYGSSFGENLISTSSTDFYISATGFYVTFYATTNDYWIACDYVAFE